MVGKISDRLAQTVLTQIRLQSGQGTYCLLFHLHLLEALLYIEK